MCFAAMRRKHTPNEALAWSDPMTLHDKTLTKDADKAAMKVVDWLEYYAPTSPAVKVGEQVAMRELDVLNQMYAYYEA